MLVYMTKLLTHSAKFGTSDLLAQFAQYMHDKLGQAFDILKRLQKHVSPTVLRLMNIPLGARPVAIYGSWQRQRNYWSRESERKSTCRPALSRLGRVRTSGCPLAIESPLGSVVQSEMNVRLGEATGGYLCRTCHSSRPLYRRMGVALWLARPLFCKSSCLRRKMVHVAPVRW